MLITEPYLSQVARWPTYGRHILAQFDDQSVVVYQAYRQSIGLFAAANGFFGGDFRLNRMSWVKTSFLWMMYRSQWGCKMGQEVVLAVRIRRFAFDHILGQAIHSTYIPEVYGSEKTWAREVQRSSVRLQWDPDHLPSGARAGRRAIQLGLRDEALVRYSREWILGIEDISGFVQEQRQHAHQLETWPLLITPREEIYPVYDRDVALRLQLSTSDGGNRAI